MTRSTLIDTTRQAKGETILYHADCAKKLHPSQQGRLALYTGSTRRLHCDFCGKPIRVIGKFPTHTDASSAELPSDDCARDSQDWCDLPDLPEIPTADNARTIVIFSKRKAKQ